MPPHHKKPKDGITGPLMVQNRSTKGPRYVKVNAVDQEVNEITTPTSF
jgi:hypothetical protein